MMDGTPTVSVIINTLNRGPSLRHTLAALGQLTYPAFEVVVVNGPSTDDTEVVLVEYADRVKVRRCPEPNLSMSRNIGIAAASGEIVAFIDDDGVPEPRWLEALVALYDTDEVAGAGGVVFDHTGHEYQCRFNSCDRLGNATFDHDHPLDDWCVPGASRFPYLIGTNSSFRRDRLLEVGGFDEEYEYYLDETDVCLRLVDAGYVLRQGTDAPVHHKFLPSDVRSESRVTLNNFPVVKNKIYFSLVNRSDEPMAQVFEDNAAFARLRSADLEHHFALGNITAEQAWAGDAQIEAAWPVGIQAGLRGRTRMIDAALVRSEREGFRPFPTVRPEGRRLRLCFVTQTLPPAETGGIGRYMLDLARALADRGHEVRIITTGTGHSTVDLESGVWVHRILKDAPSRPDPAMPAMPERIRSNATAVADEVARLHRQCPLDAVYGAMWDTETVEVFRRCAVPVVTALVTTMGISLRTRPEWRDSAEFMEALGSPLLGLERWLLDHSDAVHAISEAIIRDVDATSGTEVDRGAVTVAPLGVVDRAGAGGAPGTASGGSGCEMLFVGRFEKRKGIDLLLEAVPIVLAAEPGTRFTFIGRDDLPGEHGGSYRAGFEELHAGQEWLDRVTFRGEVSDDELWDAYRACDVFVAPSRFESFGLIFVEAMMQSRPVVALRAGAAVEVVDDAITGVLVEPDRADLLAEALVELARDPSRRSALGAAGRKRFLDEYSIGAMADRAEGMFNSVAMVRPAPVDPAAAVDLPDGSRGRLVGDGLRVEDDRVQRAAVATAVLWFPAGSGIGPLRVDRAGHEVKVDPPEGGGFVHVRMSGRPGPVELSGAPLVVLAGIVVAGIAAED